MNKLLVKKILEQAHSYDWSMQGLGMLRLYLSDAYRLHVWDTRNVKPTVAKLHTHPWHLNSTIIAGQITNQRYYEGSGTATHEYVTILCGLGGGQTEAKKSICLRASLPETYEEGQRYDQHATEIHESSPLDGTVTLIHRTFLEDKDHAKVFFPVGQNWNHTTSAEPRPATSEEVETITKNSLARWFV